MGSVCVSSISVCLFTVWAVFAGGEKHDGAEPHSISSGATPPTPCPAAAPPPKGSQPITVIN